jgi:hypothetical protein
VNHKQKYKQKIIHFYVFINQFLFFNLISLCLSEEIFFFWNFFIAKFFYFFFLILLFWLYTLHWSYNILIIYSILSHLLHYQ